MKTLEKSILQGTTHMRTHLEVDPVVGLRSLEGIQPLIEEYKWAIDLEICVFPQEGLLNNPGTDELMVEGLKQGCHVVGGAPYTDSDPPGQIDRLFEMAREYDVDVDMHLDFGNTPEGMTIEHVCNRTEEYGWGGRVTVGHMTQLSTLEVPELERITRRLADVGVAVTVLPSTDLYLMGRHQDHNVLRGVVPIHKMLRHGVNCNLSSNNVLNPFTPFGDCSLIRMANLYANICQVGQIDDTIECFDMVTRRSAELLNLDDYGIEVGKSADLVVIDNSDRQGAVAELSQPLMGIKRGHVDVQARAGPTPPARALTMPDLPFEDPVGAFCRRNHVALKGAGGGPLAGLSFGAKDVFHIAGTRTGFGHPTWLATHEAPAEDRGRGAAAARCGGRRRRQDPHRRAGVQPHRREPALRYAGQHARARSHSRGLVQRLRGGGHGRARRLRHRHRLRGLGPAAGELLRHLRHASDGRPRAARRGDPVRPALRRRRLVSRATPECWSGSGACSWPTTRNRRRRAGCFAPSTPSRWWTKRCPAPWTLRSRRWRLASARSRT